MASSGPELFVVLNSGSGAHDSSEVRSTLERLFTDAGRKYRFIDIPKPSAIEAASARAAKDAVAAGGMIVAVGGDGTLNAVAGAAWRERCLMGVIPQGTFNYFGRTHGIPQELEAAAGAMLRGAAHDVQVGLVNDYVFLVNASLGLYPQLLEDREAAKHRFGRYRWVAMLSGLKTLFEWRRQLALVLEANDGTKRSLLTPTLFVGNNKLQLEQIGIGDAVSAQVGEGAVAGIVVRPIGTFALLRLVVQGALGRLGEVDQVDGFSFRSLDVTMRGRRHVKIATDGEVRRVALPLRFSVAPHALRLVLPRPEDRVAVA